MTRDELRDGFNKTIKDESIYENNDYYVNDGDNRWNDDYIEHLEDQLLNIYNNLEDDGK